MRPEHHIKQHIMEKRAGLVPDHRIPSSVTYLRPTIVERFDTMPNPSKASRVPSDKSPFNTRATAVNPLNDTIIRMESALELKAGRILKTMDVIEIREQIDKVDWIDHDGVVHTHTFDFWIRKRSGKRVAIAVKPFGKLASTRLIDMLILIKEQGIGGIADDVSFITEYFASEYAAANAEEILFARRARNDEDVEETKEILRQVRGRIRFGELLKDLEIQAFRRTALWVLIGEGWLRPVIPARIEDHTLMQVIIPTQGEHA